jgi:hypothetical protein
MEALTLSLDCVCFEALPLARRYKPASSGWQLSQT